MTMIERRIQKMPGLHRYHTIAFRPTTWERELIEKRCELSGLMKKDFIIQSCIHSKVVVAVTRERMLRIIGECPGDLWLKLVIKLVVR